MSVSAEMYIVISLMFAVFAAVAAVGTSIVLGAGFERLRAGFEVIRRQTGFFADAIHKLDNRTKLLNEEGLEMRQSLEAMGIKVERVDKQTSYFADAIHNLEQKIEGAPATPAASDEEPILPREMDYLLKEEPLEQPSYNAEMLETMSFNTPENTQDTQEEAQKPLTEKPKQELKAEAQEIPASKNPGLSKLLSSYFAGHTPTEERTYH